jgi:hypothetical protein
MTDTGVKSSRWNGEKNGIRLK